MLFQSKHSLVDVMQARSACDIEREPMFYRASQPFAMEHGGPLTREFLRILTMQASALSLRGAPVVIDSRTHMLMRGWWPCIPGWHHDDVPRDTPNGQPNYDRPAYRARHLMCVIDAVDAPTGALPQFIAGAVDVPWPLSSNVVVYGAWDSHINALAGTTQAKLMQIDQVESRNVVTFDCDAFHRGMPARNTGWRWFIRATWDTHVQPEDKVRRNANVYLAAPAAGW